MRGREKALAVVGFINTELAIQRQRLKEGAADKKELNKIRKNVNTLTNLRNSYQLVYNSYTGREPLGNTNAEGLTIDEYLLSTSPSN